MMMMGAFGGHTSRTVSRSARNPATVSARSPIVTAEAELLHSNRVEQAPIMAMVFMVSFHLMVSDKFCSWT